MKTIDNRHLGLAAFVVGFAAIGWVAAGYLKGHPLAFLMTLVITAVYFIGAVELRRYQRATETLVAALEKLPEAEHHLADWLARIHPSLQNAVRLRLEGERAALPGPSVAPYLVGLLVMLGMLGTFLGMVVTLNGAVLALETTTDLPTIRAALSAPVKGLGLAFGTSVAGVAASAMLGLIAALTRRERLRASQQLDARIGTDLRGYSLAQQRLDTYKALQVQAQTLPQIVGQMQEIVSQMARQNEALHERLIAGQTRFHDDNRTAYDGLAKSVGLTLHGSLTEAAKAAGAAIQPAVDSAMRQLASETEALHRRLGGQVEQQLAGLSERFATSTQAVSNTWTAALADQRRTQESTAVALQEALGGAATSFSRAGTDLVAAVQDQQARHAADLAHRESERMAAFIAALASQNADLRTHWQRAGEATIAQQQRITQTLETTAQAMAEQNKAHAQATIDEIARLMQSAAEAPRVAAEVIAQLREQLSASLSRDNAQLEERARLMETLDTLLNAINRAATEQRSAIDQLIGSTAEVLDRVSREFGTRTEADATRLTDTARQMTGSAAEVGALSEAFGHGVTVFAEASDRTLAGLQRIETALAQAMQRSDEQLAYTIAQARELIDLTLMAQQKALPEAATAAALERADG